MKKLFLYTCLLLITSISLKAQTAAKSAYIEIGGPGLLSANFDTRFSKQEGGLGGRMGFGFFSIINTYAVTLPVGLNYLLGKDNKNYFELGAGATFTNAMGIFENKNEDAISSPVFGHLTIGYRLQPAKGGFLFRAAIVPVFGKGFFIPYYAGISFGYKFK